MGPAAHQMSGVDSDSLGIQRIHVVSLVHAQATAVKLACVERSIGRCETGANDDESLTPVIRNAAGAGLAGNWYRRSNYTERLEIYLAVSILLTGRSNNTEYVARFRSIGLERFLVLSRRVGCILRTGAATIGIPLTTNRFPRE